MKLGLIELPESIPLNDYVQPAKLPNDCQFTTGNEELVAKGNGMKDHWRDPDVRDKRVREAHIESFEPDICDLYLDNYQ